MQPLLPRCSDFTAVVPQPHFCLPLATDDLLNTRFQTAVALRPRDGGSFILCSCSVTSFTSVSSSSTVGVLGCYAALNRDLYLYSACALSFCLYRETLSRNPMLSAESFLSKSVLCFVFPFLYRISLNTPFAIFSLLSLHGGLWTKIQSSNSILLALVHLSS